MGTSDTRIYKIDPVGTTAGSAESQHEFPLDILNIAAICSSTCSLGPEKRAAVWVQGCPFRCPGCIAPNWVDIKPARLVRPEALVQEIMVEPGLQGLTFSGGEPMLQAAGLARLARLAREQRDLDIICFTGFSLPALLQSPPGPGVLELLDLVDVLIDGPYIERLNNNLGLRGSSNQGIHHITDRLRGYDFLTSPRKAEIRLTHDEMMLVGVPPDRLREAYRQAVHWAVQQAAVTRERVAAP